MSPTVEYNKSRFWTIARAIEEPSKTDLLCMTSLMQQQISLKKSCEKIIGFLLSSSFNKVVECDATLPLDRESKIAANERCVSDFVVAVVVDSLSLHSSSSSSSIFRVAVFGGFCGGSSEKVDWMMMMESSFASRSCRWVE